MAEQNTEVNCSIYKQYLFDCLYRTVIKYFYMYLFYQMTKLLGTLKVSLGYGLQIKHLNITSGNYCELLSKNVYYRHGSLPSLLCMWR